ncbi:hypothetical protein N0V84_008871 [Fusarium piperis]|uniref:MFS transporter n=1 Tax=Fusarium piperis TaxID=1435070 RepID=A0A9W9BJ54_9HYPO|nr:hypothetical protein N0V84_008871 [Fusarium piperis]
MAWCFLAAAIISGLSPAYLMIEADRGISVADLSTGNGLLYLFLGWGTLIIQNFALTFGRRITLVASILLTTSVTLWSAYVESRAVSFINRIILGIVSSPMETVDYPAQPKTFMQRLALGGFQSPRPATKHAILLPFQLLRYPTIVFGGFLVGGILSWYNVVGGSLALILGNEPYNFGTNMIGLFYLAAVVSVSIGCVLCSMTSDRMAMWFARRNGGVMEPEQRLWLCILACLLYGIGAAYHLHWVGIAFGLGLTSVTLPIGSALTFSSILGSYREVAGEGLVTSILIRNLMGFSFSYSVVPMIENLSLKNAFILIAVLGLVLWCMCLVMILIGKSLRQSSAESYWRLVDKLGATVH